MPEAASRPSTAVLAHRMGARRRGAEASTGPPGSSRPVMSFLLFCLFVFVDSNSRDMMSLDGAEVALGLFPPVMEHIYLSENAHLEKWRGV